MVIKIWKMIKIQIFKIITMILLTYGTIHILRRFQRNNSY